MSIAACTTIQLRHTHACLGNVVPCADIQTTSLRRWLNQNMRLKMTDGRYLVGIFLCTDKDCNLILGSCQEYLQHPDDVVDEPRMLGLAMIPGKHIVTIEIDQPKPLIT